MYTIDNCIFFCRICLLLMKNKNIEHPRIYLQVIEKDNSTYLNYIDNQFDQSGNRIIKKCILDSVNHNNNSKKHNKLLSDLNILELRKTNNYIKTQNKVLDYHIKNNNYDSISIVKDSIKLMELFKEQLLANEF